MNSFDPSQGPQPFKCRREPVDLDLVNEGLLMAIPRLRVREYGHDQERSRFIDLYHNDYKAFERARSWIRNERYWLWEEAHFRALN